MTTRSEWWYQRWTCFKVGIVFSLPSLVNFLILKFLPVRHFRFPTYEAAGLSALYDMLVAFLFSALLGDNSSARSFWAATCVHMLLSILATAYFIRSVQKREFRQSNVFPVYMVSYFIAQYILLHAVIFNLLWSKSAFDADGQLMMAVLVSDPLTALCLPILGVAIDLRGANRWANEDG